MKNIFINGVNQTILIIYIDQRYEFRHNYKSKIHIGVFINSHLTHYGDFFLTRNMNKRELIYSSHIFSVISFTLKICILGSNKAS